MPVKKIVSFLLIFLTLAAGAYAQEQLNICIIRVEFQEDNNELTTGNGKFVYDATGVTRNTIDPPPHNRRYFQDQLLAVANYFTAASKGNQSITGTVFPRAQQAAYLLPEEMGFYNPNTTDEENDRQFALLISDAIKAADADPDLRFSDFDVVAIFHAGVGKDIDLGFDETPQDIPSFYATPEFMKRSLGADFDGILVDNGSYKIDRALLLPETESQDGLELGLTGIFAANIGSHLGLYDLFSPADQLSGIGTFGLMDSGLFNMFGLSPAMPSAFSRTLMGWETPVEVTGPEPGLVLNRFEGSDSQGITVYRIPINNTEHYLIEYRGERQINVDSVLAVLAEGRDQLPTYLEVLRSYLPDRITVSDSTGVLLKIDNYDWGLPGAGILIWHIDEAVIAEKGAGNRINDDRSHRAVDVEEADGSQDIGYSYSVVEAGFQSELGTWLDFWFDGNPSPLYSNEFSGKSAPNTYSYLNNARSNIKLYDFSDNFGPAMTFSYHRDFYENGFPASLSVTEKPEFTGDLYFVEIESLSKPAVFVHDNNGNVYALTDNGKGLFDPDDPRILAGTGDNLFMVFADTNTNDRYDMLFTVTTAGLVKGFRLSTLAPDELFSIDLGDSVSVLPVVQYPFLYVGAESGKIYRIHFDGRREDESATGGRLSGFTISQNGGMVPLLAGDDRPSYAPVLIDLNSDGLQDTVIFDTRHTILINPGSSAAGIELNNPVTGPPAFGDFDQDGTYEIFVPAGETLFAFNYNGVSLNNFPLFPVLTGGELITGAPLILDMDGDAICDVVVCTGSGLIYAYDHRGRLLDGFPFSTGLNITGSMAAGDIDGDLKTELFATNGTDLYGWELMAPYDQNFIWWTQAAHNPTNNQLVTRALTQIPPTVAQLMPDASAYAYPNPNKENYTNIRYFLRQDAQVMIDIFDLAGDLVSRFEGPGRGAVDNEIRWDLANISNGVYLCRIEATAAGEQSVKIIKIMVIK